ncbi:methyltransferase domain-containing protein [Sulfurovum sp.]|uniref:class I SAM-dependent methyltransferase n=1 Tax=Sulfurovum sp. TaxID=1969726 RepID=UPI0035668D08
MLFPEKVKSIKATDKVLEVGPGGTPFPRSDVLLEKIFSEKDAKEQRGLTEALDTDQKVVYYSGGKFPFEDNEFDYVICSHVLEHIPENEFVSFVNELQRVAKNGYIEYPTIYYEYLYNFKVHVTLLNYKDNAIYYMDKDTSNLNRFLSVQTFFYETLQHGYDEIVRENKAYFFQGFEWEHKINIIKSDDMQDFLSFQIKLVNKNQLSRKRKFINIIKQYIRKII